MVQLVVSLPFCYEEYCEDPFLSCDELEQDERLT